MLVNIEPHGRLGNRLFLDAHLSAFCWKYNFELRNTTLDAFGPSFPQLSPPRGSVLGLWLRSQLPLQRHFRYWGREDLDYDAVEIPDLLEPLRAGQTVFFHGWLFRGFQSVQRFRPNIAEKYRPSPEIESWVESVMRKARSEAEVVVGVHIRWEDYRGTPHFLTQEEYQANMRAVAAGLGRPTVFLVFSNETLPDSDWGGLKVLLPRGSAVQDLAAMAGCDYLLAPPSTFSGWASFYGQVPLAQVRRDSTNLALSDFAVVRG